MQNQDKIKPLLELIAQGENSSVEFKKEELSRLFQQAGLVHYDIAPVDRTAHGHNLNFYLAR